MRRLRHYKSYLFEEVSVWAYYVDKYSDDIEIRNYKFVMEQFFGRRVISYQIHELDFDWFVLRVFPVGWSVTMVVRGQKYDFGAP